MEKNFLRTAFQKKKAVPKAFKPVTFSQIQCDRFDAIDCYILQVQYSNPAAFGKAPVFLVLLTVFKCGDKIVTLFYCRNKTTMHPEFPALPAWQAFQAIPASPGNTFQPVLPKECLPALS